MTAFSKGWWLCLPCLFALAACGPRDQGLPNPSTGTGAKANEAKLPTPPKAQPSPAVSKESFDEPVIRASVEVLKAEARVWPALLGSSTCVDLSATERICAGGDAKAANPENEFLVVAVDFRNLGAQTFEVPGGFLEVVYEGEVVRYESVGGGDSAPSIAQPYGRAILRGSFEVPIRVLDSGEFHLRTGELKIPLTFESPAQASERKALAVREAAAQEEVNRAERTRIEANSRKCWALNDKESPEVSEVEFSWYVENCSHMFDVGDYRTYVRYRSQLR